MCTKPKKQFRTQALAEEAYARANESAGLFSLGLQYVLNGKPTATYRKGAYRFALYHPNNSHGGLMLQTFAPAGQSPHTTAHWWESWCETARRNVAFFSDCETKEATIGVIESFTKAIYALRNHIEPPISSARFDRETRAMVAAGIDPNDPDMVPCLNCGEACADTDDQMCEDCIAALPCAECARTNGPHYTGECDH